MQTKTDAGLLDETSQERSDHTDQLSTLPLSSAESVDPQKPVPSYRVWVSTACFWVLCLTLSAAGHWVYVATRSLDHRFSSNEYRSPVQPVVWVGHGSLEQAKQRAAARIDVISPATLAAADNLCVLPISRFWLGAAFVCTAMAMSLAWIGRWIANRGVQSLIGLYAGHALWLGAIEIGLDNAGRRLGLAGSLAVVNGKLVGVHAAGILIQLSIVFLIPLLIGFALHESNRCVLFHWFRARLPLTRRAAATGQVENYAARTTIQFFMTVWVCYVSVLWMADGLFGSFGPTLLFMVFVLIVLATPYMIWRTTRQASTGQMLRYSVSGAVVTWTGIEIAAAMGFIREPWLDESMAVGTILIGLSLVLSFTAYRCLGRLSYPMNAATKAASSA